LRAYLFTQRDCFACAAWAGLIKQACRRAGLRVHELDAHEYHEAATQLHVRVTPTLVVVDSRRAVLRRWDGMDPAKAQDLAQALGLEPAGR
jgi:hypothetical protein